MPKDINDFVVWFVALAAILTAAFLFISTDYHKTDYPHTLLYIVPGSFGDRPVNGSASFEFAIENRELEPAEYSLEIFVAGKKADSFGVTLDEDEKEEFSRSYPIDESTLLFPIKIWVVAETKGKTYDVYFYLREHEDREPLWNPPIGEAGG